LKTITFPNYFFLRTKKICAKIIEPIKTEGILDMLGLEELFLGLFYQIHSY
jgi:hypothetical protein